MGKSKKYNGKKDEKIALNKQGYAPVTRTEKIITGKKKTLSGGAKIAIATGTVFAIAVAAFVLWRTGTFTRWFPGKDAINVGDYQTIEIDKDYDAEINEDAACDYAESLTSYFKETVEDKDAKAKEGDTTCISFKGTIDGEEFEGGSADDYDLVLGSGSFIEGFEDGIIGMKAGETKTLHLKFPEDYSETNTELNGADVNFEVTLKEIQRAPELTDEFISEHIEDLIDKNMFPEAMDINTIDGYVAWYMEHGNDSNLYTAMLQELEDTSEVTSRNSIKFAEVKEYIADQFASSAATYGIDANTMATYYGYENIDDYAEQEATVAYDRTLMFKKISDDLGVTVSDEELNAALQKMIDEDPENFQNEDGSTLTPTKIKELIPGFITVYRDFQLRYFKIMPLLKDRVVFVKKEEKTTDDGVIVETGTDSGSADTEVDADTETVYAKDMPSCFRCSVRLVV